MPKKKGYFHMTPLQQRFIANYLRLRNGTSAYMESTDKKITRQVAAASANKLLKLPDIKAAIARAIEAAAEKAEMSAEDTLRQLKRVTMYDVRKLFDADGKPLKIHELDDEMATAIVGIKVVTKGNFEMGLGEVMEYKLADRVAGIEKAMKYHGLYEKDNEQKSDPVVEMLAFIGQRGSRIVPRS